MAPREGTARAAADDLVAFLARVAGGRLEASVDGASLAVLDGEARRLTVQLDTLRGPGPDAPSLLEEGHVRLWAMRGVPSALARAGWSVSLHDGPSELVRIGREASPLTGHVSVSPSSLWKLRRWI